MIMIVIRSPMSPFLTTGSVDLHLEDLSRMISGAHWVLGLTKGIPCPSVMPVIACTFVALLFSCLWLWVWDIEQQIHICICHHRSTSVLL
jgi:hypothetical protein